VLRKKHVFDSKGIVVGMGWQTLALCIGIFRFSIVYIAAKISLSCSFLGLHTTNG